VLVLKKVFLFSSWLGVVGTALEWMIWEGIGLKGSIVTGGRNFQFVVGGVSTSTERYDLLILYSYKVVGWE
jgi:hypothetical protein